MKTRILNHLNYLRLSMVALATLSISSCSDDDDPEVINEEEIITTMNITLATSGAADVMLQSRDLDGDGPDAPVVTADDLSANTTYTGTIELLNETESPAEDITEEVAEEDDEHQFFFNANGSLSEVMYADADDDGNPVGISFTLTTGDAGTGVLQVVLRHEPKKPNDGTLSDAGGETDISQTFNVTVQ